MITPTVGRIVWYRDPEAPSLTPRAGILTGVHKKMAMDVYHLVDVTVFPPGSSAMSLAAVPLVQPGDRTPDFPYCEWMPYQVKKSTGSESGEKAAGSKAI